MKLGCSLFTLFSIILGSLIDWLIVTLLGMISPMEIITLGLIIVVITLIIITAMVYQWGQVSWREYVPHDRKGYSVLKPYQ